MGLTVFICTKNNKMLALNIANRFMKSLLSRVRIYNSSKPATGNNNKPELACKNYNALDNNDSNDYQAFKILIRLNPSKVNDWSGDALLRYKFLLHILDPNEKRSEQTDFSYAKNSAVEWRVKRNIWLVYKKSENNRYPKYWRPVCTNIDKLQNSWIKTKGSFRISTI